jgi:hypothetical protein
MRLAAAATLILATVALAGCGKAGRPISPDPTPHPQIYPQVMPASQQALKTEMKKPGEGTDPNDALKPFTKSGAFIDPSARVNMNANRLDPSGNITQRTVTSGRGDVGEPNNQIYVDQPLTEPRP